MQARPPLGQGPTVVARHHRRLLLGQCASKALRARRCRRAGERLLTQSLRECLISISNKSPDWITETATPYRIAPLITRPTTRGVAVTFIGYPSKNLNCKSYSIAWD